MIFWMREIVGWVLVALGLYGFYLTYFELLKNGRIVESAPAAFMSFIIFRGGIHLVKVAAAIRLSREGWDSAHARQRPTPRTAAERRNVLPGVSSSPRV